MGESLGVVLGGSVWEKLWKLKIPNKIKVFGWRACLDILPTRENLPRRRIIKDDRCGVCSLAKESGYHVLWECGLAQDIWASCPSRLQKGTSGHDDMLHLVEHMQHRLTDDELELFWVQSWLIWNQRNSMLHGGVIQDPGRMNQQVKDYLEEFREAQIHLAISDTIAPVQAWHPPSGLLYKMNFDTVVFANTNSTGFVAII